MEYDASATWSGFNYQGKVALFYTLKLINEKLSENIDFDFGGYALTLEQYEDFQISVNLINKSFHQVKAYKNKAFSQYKDALLEIALVLRNHPGVSGFIHTRNDIYLTGNVSFVQAIRNDLESIVDQYENSVDKNKTDIVQALSTKTKIGKRAAILRKAFPAASGYTEQSIRHALNGICDENIGSVCRISQFKYPDGSLACDIDAIESLIVEELEVLFDKKTIVNTPKQKENAYLHLLGELDCYIVKRHLMLNQGKPISIPFDYLITEVTCDFEDISNQYLEYHFKNMFVVQFERYCEETEFCPDDSYEKCIDGEGCNLKEMVSILFGLPAKTLLQYYIKFAPHRDYVTGTNILNTWCLNEEDVWLVLFPIFYDINSKMTVHREGINRISYRSNSDSTNLYLPTIIRSGYPAGSLAKKIIDNPSMTEVLYEIKTLIAESGTQPIYSLEKVFNKQRSVGNLQTYCNALPADKKDKIVDILSDLRVIPLDQAKGEIDAH